MDSVTQIVLGAAVGEAVLGRQIGNRAIVAGAVFGSLPDLDILVPFADAVASFTYHRSFSHSWVLLSCLSPLLAYLTHRFGAACSLKRWWLMIFLALNTHVLLDCFTVYGTQALWPLSDYPIGWSTIFIIDPIYTVPLIAGLILTSRRNPQNPRRSLFNNTGLLISSLYLCWTVVAHHLAQQRAITQLQAQSIAYSSIHTTPTPFSLLWRFNALTDDAYYEGFYSLTDSPEHVIRFSRYRKNEHLAKPLSDHWPVQRLRWFTRGYYRMSEVDDEILMTDLRMGIEASYVFNFAVGTQDQNGTITGKRSELIRFQPDVERVKLVFRRMLDESVSLLPPADDAND